MQSDNYTIPCWIAWLAGSPVDYDTRCSHIHDQWCYNREALMVTLTETELRTRGYLRYSDKNKMWVCEDIPAEFLTKRKVTKWETDNMLYECMEAARVPFISMILIRTGTIFNIGWLVDMLTGKVFELELDKVYDEEYWDRHVRGK